MAGRKQGSTDASEAGLIVRDSIRHSLGMPLPDEIVRLRSGITDSAITEAAGLGMWIGHGVVLDYPGATEEILHDALGEILPVLEVEPEVANVVYEEAMRTSGL